MSEINKEWLIAAKECLKNSQRQLVYAAKAFKRAGGNFEPTIKEIKETIGDLEMAIESLEEHGVQ
jgi:hypothetical protein